MQVVEDDHERPSSRRFLEEPCHGVEQAEAGRLGVDSGRESVRRDPARRSSSPPAARTTWIHGQYAGAPPSSQQRPVHAPVAVEGVAASSWIRLVLPMPGSPVTRTRPSPPGFRPLERRRELFELASPADELLRRSVCAGVARVRQARCSFLAHRCLRGGGELLLAPGDGKRRLHISQRRELRLQAVGDELVDLLGADEPFQLVPPQVAQRDAGRRLLGQQARGQRRDEHLAAVSGRADPRAPDDVQPVVAGLGQTGLAGVDPDADPDLDVARPARWDERALRVDGG